MTTSKVRSSNQVFIDEDLDMRVHKIKQLTAGTASGHGVEFDQLNTAISTAVNPILATIHAPTADLTAAKAVASAARANAQLMMIETLGLFWYDADNAAASNDDTIIRPGDIASDLTVGRWVRHYQTKLYQPNGANPFVYTDNSGQLHIDGNIIQNGSAYETHAEQVYTKDDQIILRDGAVAALANGAYAGFKAKLYDGVNDGYLVFDNTGTARVGDIGSEQPIATRIESPTGGHYAIWDGTNLRLNFAAAGLAAVGNGSAQYQIPVTGATTFTPGWTTAANLVGASGLNALSYVSASFIKMTAANTFALRTLAETLSDLGAAPASGSGNYIQNQSGGAQNATFWVNGYPTITGNASANALMLRTRAEGDYTFLNWKSYDASELLAEQYIHRTAANTATMNYTINNGTGSTVKYLTIASSGAATFASSVSSGGDITLTGGNRSVISNGGFLQLSTTSGNIYMSPNGAAALTLATNGSATFSSTVSVLGNMIQIITDGSNDVAAGPFLKFANVAGNNQNLIQLNASGGWDYWNYNTTRGSWYKDINITKDGAITASGSGTFNGAANTEALNIKDLLFLQIQDATQGGKIYGYNDPSSWPYASGLKFQTRYYSGSAYLFRDVLTLSSQGNLYVLGSGIFGNLAGTGNRSVYIDADGKLCAGAAGSGLAGNRVYRATPSGTINGTNPTFTITGVSIVTGSEEVFKNGQLMNVGSGNDYTIAVSGGNTIITFETGAIPNTVGATDVILVNYTPQ